MRAELKVSMKDHSNREIWTLRQMLSNAGQKIMSIISPVRGIRLKGEKEKRERLT